MSELVPCRECHRHVRVGAPCPFCGAAAQPSALRAAARGSGRFGLLFAGAITLGACGEQASPDLEPPPQPAPVEAEPVELEARPVEPEPAPVEEVDPVVPEEVAPVPAEEPPRVIARPRPPVDAPVPAYGGPALRQPTPDPGGAVAAYGGPSTMGSPDDL